jgi:hypothetical protein
MQTRKSAGPFQQLEFELQCSLAAESWILKGDESAPHGALVGPSLFWASATRPLLTSPTSSRRVSSRRAITHIDKWLHQIIHHHNVLISALNTIAVVFVLFF